jgi:hypothetical protein
VLRAADRDLAAGSGDGAGRGKVESGVTLGRGPVNPRGFGCQSPLCSDSDGFRSEVK